MCKSSLFIGGRDPKWCDYFTSFTVYVVLNVPYSTDVVKMGEREPKHPYLRRLTTLPFQ